MLVSEPRSGTDEGDLLEVLDELIDVLRSQEIPFLLIGGIASSIWGRDRGTRDVDVLVRPETARRVLDALSLRGYETSLHDEHWLFKAKKDGVCIDVIFRSTRDILLNEEMIARSRSMPFRGRHVPVAPPEDLIVMKAVAASEDTPRYWYDALAILAHNPDLDWAYLVERAKQHGARRILSLLLFATSIDLVIPTQPIGELLRSIRLAEQAI